MVGNREKIVSQRVACGVMYKIHKSTKLIGTTSIRDCQFREINVLDPGAYIVCNGEQLQSFSQYYMAQQTGFILIVSERGFYIGD